MSFFQKVSPIGGIKDLISYVGEARPHRLLFLIIACQVPALLIYGLYLQHKLNTAPPPQTIIYFESWTLDRTDEEVIAQQKIDGAKKTARLKAKQEAYKKLGRQIGIESE